MSNRDDDYFESPASKRLAKYIADKRKREQHKIIREEAKSKKKKIQEEKKGKLNQGVLDAATIASVAAKRRKLDAQNATDELASRKRDGVCVCCKDNCDIKENGYCVQCWREITFGEIPMIGVSRRQVNSMACRVIRKGHEMS